MGKTVEQLLPWQGNTVIEHMIAIGFASQASEVIVILGANAQLISKVLTPIAGCHVIENEGWQDGLSSSIAYGVEYLENNLPASDGVLLLLCDQPLLTSSYLDLLIDSFSHGDKNIIASNYGEMAGPPVLFGRKYFTELKRIGPRGGAQDILVKYGGDMLVRDPGRQIMDMDVAEEYQQLLQIRNNKEISPENEN
jgi:molybdenum cofactor cytidylyltransferase